MSRSRGRRWAVALFAAACSVGCASSPPPSGAESSPPPAPPPPPRAPADRDAKVDRVLEDALEHVASVREIPPKGQVKSTLISRAALKQRIERDVIADLEPEVIEGTAELLFALNLTRTDFDYLASLLKLFGTQLAGFYDPRAKEMVLLDDLGVEAQKATLWHELVHALQDQHYDLHPLLKWRPDRGDAISAILGLAEGDASSAMLDVMLLPQGQKATDVPETLFVQAIGAIEALPEVADVPAILKRSVAVPYTDGLRFVHALRRQGGWEAVDAAWRELPQSTEQILHPEKYFAREAPETLELPLPPSTGPREMLYHDVLGEQMVRLVFEDWVPLETAKQAAAGWAGDRVAVFRAANERAVAARLRYDEEASAVRAFEVIARGATKPELEDSAARTGDRERAQRAARAGSFCEERKRRGAFAAVRRGRDLTVTLGPYQRGSEGVVSGSKCAKSLPWAFAVAGVRFTGGTVVKD